MTQPDVSFFRLLNRRLSLAECKVNSLANNRPTAEDARRLEAEARELFADAVKLAATRWGKVDHGS